MGWQDLLARPDDAVVVPWTGGRDIRAAGRALKVRGALPADFGWHSFIVSGGRDATWKEPVDFPDLDTLFQGKRLVRGYLVGDRLVPDGAAVPVGNPAQAALRAEPVHLVEPGLERFARARAGRWDDGRLIYVGQEFPLGPEDAVATAYQDRASSVDGIPGVSPALDLAFRFETWARAEADRARAEAEAIAREEAARQEAEARRVALVNALGDGAGRRAMAKVDFGVAAAAALRVGGAELLDWRDSRMGGEAVVQFRYRGDRFECVCTKATLRIVDAGVCLVNHATGERGDTRFTLESLPAVIGYAMDQHRLVKFRNVNQRGGYVRNEDDFYDEDDD